MRRTLVAALVAMACRDQPPKQRAAISEAPHAASPAPIYVLPTPGPKLPDDEIFATNSPTYGALEGATLKALLPPSLGDAPLVAHADGRYSAAATYQLPGGKRATLDLQNTYHRGTHSDSLEELQDKSPRLCAKHDTLQGADACIATRTSGDAGTVIRWYLFDRIVVHLTAPSEALARDLATYVPIDRIATLSAAP